LGCVNPRHLAWKTPKENQADKIIHGVHNRGERNGNAVLTAEKVQEIRRLKASVPRKKLAEIYGVTLQTISKVTTGARWSHIP
jgi:DNA-binding transcriptional regulator YiaG